MQKANELHCASVLQVTKLLGPYEESLPAWLCHRRQCATHKRTSKRLAKHGLPQNMLPKNHS